MANNISWYRHQADADRHWKFKALRRVYGWAGEGKFWALNNRMALAKDCKLKISDENMRREMAADLDFDLEELDQFITFLSSPRCQLLKQEDEHIFTPDVQEDLEKFNKNRLKNQAYYDEKKRQPAENKIQPAENKIQPAENKIQKIKTAENEIKGAESSHITLHSIDTESIKSNIVTNVTSDEQAQSLPNFEKNQPKKSQKTEKEKKPDPEKEKSPAAEKKKTLRQLLRDPIRNTFLAWYKSTEARVFLWDYGKHDKALNRIVDHFIAWTTDEFKGMNAGEEQVVARAKNLFSDMLLNWGRLEEFYASKKTITEMAANLNQILSQQNAYTNGNGKKNWKNHPHQPVITGTATTSGKL